MHANQRGYGTQLGLHERLCVARPAFLLTPAWIYWESGLRWLEKIQDKLYYAKAPVVIPCMAFPAYFALAAYGYRSRSDNMRLHFVTRQLYILRHD